MLGICAVLLAIGFSAFTAPAEKSLLDPQWYILTLNGDPEVANDYVVTESQPCDDTTGEICGVQAMPDPGNPGHPNLSGSTTFVKRN